MNDKAPCHRSCHQFLLRYHRPTHAPSAPRTGTDEPDNSRCWWLWTRLSPWPVWRMPSQRLLRRRVLRWRCSGARRGSSPRCGGCRTGRGSTQVPSRLQPVPMLDGLLTVNSPTRHELANEHLKFRRHKIDITHHAGVMRQNGNLKAIAAPCQYRTVRRADLARNASHRCGLFFGRVKGADLGLLLGRSSQ